MSVFLKQANSTGEEYFTLQGTMWFAWLRMAGVHAKAQMSGSNCERGLYWLSVQSAGIQALGLFESKPQAELAILRSCLLVF